jgi:hypothetical protein
LISTLFSAPCFFESLAAGFAGLTVLRWLVLPESLCGRLRRPYILLPGLKPLRTNLFAAGFAGLTCFFRG